jgi:hypothetical protein
MVIKQMRLLVLMCLLGTALFAEVEFLEIHNFAVSAEDPIGDLDSTLQGNKSRYAAWGDYDLDGDPDLYVVNDGSPNALYKNLLCDLTNPCRSVGLSLSKTHILKFEKMTTAARPKLVILKDGVSASRYAQWVDYDQDGDLDLYLVNDGMNRLYINELFSPERPFDPFSSRSLEEQAVKQDSFTYKVHPELFLEMGSEDDLHIVTNILTLTIGGNAFPKAGTKDVFEDTTPDFVQVNPRLTPGMYLEILEAADPGIVGNRLTILEVLGPHQLRLEHERDLAPIFRYRILRDSKLFLGTTDEFIDIFASEGDVILNSVLFELKDKTAEFSLLDENVAEGDQLVVHSVGQEVPSTLTVLIQVDPRSFTIQPPPVLNGNLVTDQAFFSVRRKNGEILLQKFFSDLSLILQNSPVQPGDQVEILSGSNTGRRFIIESITPQGVVFLDSTPGSVEVSEDLNDIEYDFIYQGASTQTERIFKDDSGSFGISEAERATGAAENGNRMLKVGDHILLEPNLDLNIAGEINPPVSEATALGVRTTYDDGTVRDFGTLRIRKILSGTEIEVDAFPSEVIPGSLNDDFSYLLLHRSGRLKVDINTGLLGFFDENATAPIGVRDFLSSLSFGLVEDNPNNPFFILSDVRPASSEKFPLKLSLNTYKGKIIEKLGNNNIELSVAVKATDVSTTVALEYRPIYLGLGTENPYNENPNILRFFGATPPGLSSGHFIFLRNFVDTAGINRLLNFKAKITEVKGTEDVTDLKLRKTLPDILIQEFQNLCANPTSTCDPGPDGDKTIQDTFFLGAPSQLSVEYEYVATPAVQFGELLELQVQGRVSLFTQGLSLGQLSLTSGDSLEFANPLGGDVLSSQVGLFVSSLQVLLETVGGTIDASVSPFNTDLAVGTLGFKPIYRGTLTDFRLIQSSNPAIDFTSMARIQDKVAFFSVVPGKGLTLVERLEIGTVKKDSVQLKRTLLLDPKLQGIDPSTFQTNPFYFRFIRTSGKITALPAFRDRRVGISFRERVLTETDDTIRGIVLLDVYKVSTSVTDPIFKRFRLRSLIADNVIEIFPGALDRENDTFSNYFYKIRKVSRDTGNILENDLGNGVGSEFADWNSDGVKDLFILNQAADPSDLTLTHNTSSLLYGSGTTSSLTIGLDFKPPATLVSDQENELLNLPSVPPVTRYLKGQVVISEDFDGDLIDDLLITNDGDGDRLFFSRPLEAAVVRELYSQRPFDGPEPGSLFGLNPINLGASLQTARRRPVVGDINRDGRQDVYMLASSNTAQTFSNQLFLLGNGGFISTVLPINDVLVQTMEKGDSRSGEMLDLDNDGFMDLSVLNSDEHYLIEPKFLGAVSEGGTSIRKTACGTSPDGENNNIQWADVNLDGFPDYYISRGGDEGVTNILCISQPDTLIQTRNHYFALELLPRNLAGRKAQDPTRDIHRGQITLTDTSDPNNATPPTFQIPFEYNYPYRVRSILGTGLSTALTAQIQWSEDSTYDYGNVTSTLITQGLAVLEQPDDFPVVNAAELLSTRSSKVSTLKTSVGPKTTNIEAVGIMVFGGRREPLIFQSLSVFIAGSGFFEFAGAAATLEQGLLPRGSIKLYMDGSIQDVGSDDFKTWTPDGEFDQNHDRLLAIAKLESINPEENLYPKILDENGLPVAVESIFQARFKNISYPSRSGTAVTSIVLNPAIDGKLAERIGLLVVYTIDVQGDAFSTRSLQVLPYIPVRVDPGQIQARDRQVAAENATNTQAFLSSSFNLGLDIELQGIRSLQLHKSVAVDTSNFGSAEPASFTSLPLKDLQFQAIANIVGVQASVDQTSPVQPSLEICPGGSILPSLISTLAVELCGKAEPLSFIRIRNLSTGAQGATTQGLENGLWSQRLVNLREGLNEIQLTSVDLFGNESLELAHQIRVDITAPQVSGVLVTNIGQQNAVISWNSSEKAVGFLTLKALPPESPVTGAVYGLEQEFFEASQLLFQTGHSITVGQANRIFSGFNPDGSIPDECHVVELEGDFSALCPDSLYEVSISMRDELGNLGQAENIVSFKTQALFETVATKDLDGNGELDLDSDGDGLPDTVEADPRFPELDRFDNTDALLDFDRDGVNNVEEFKAGRDMYNPFDVLPIANAGEDRNIEPGIVILDSRNSNQNGISTGQLIFIWTIESAPNQQNLTFPLSPPVIDSPLSAKTFFTARKSGFYHVSLKIQTNQGVTSEKDEVVFSLKNLPPVAHAGSNHSGRVSAVTEGEGARPIVLDGRLTRDPNGDALSYLWIQLSGPELGNQEGGFGLSQPRSELTSFITDRAGKYEFQLIVTDPLGLVSRDEVLIHVNSNVDVFPIADAGGDVITSVDLAVELQGERSGGASKTSSLLFTWELISQTTKDVPERCKDLESDTQVASTLISTEESPRVQFSKAGIYAYKLNVREQGKGLESAPDCVRVLVNDIDSLLPISKPGVVGTPIRFSDKLSTSKSIQKSVQGQSISESVSLYRVPVNFEVELSGLSSYPDHDQILASNLVNNVSIFNQAVTTDDCLVLEQPYDWVQVLGPKTSLSPVIADCSKVTFLPLEMGIYSFELSVQQTIDGRLQKSLPRAITILVNDHFNEIPAETGQSDNNFIPSVLASADVVQSLGSLFRPQPLCMDRDLIASPSIDAAPFGEHNLPLTELQPCDAIASTAEEAETTATAGLTRLECLWTQVDGPPVVADNLDSCSPVILPGKAGTYTFSIQVFDGEFFSLSDEFVTVVVGQNEIAPIANAGADQSITVGVLSSLNGNLSIGSTANLDFLWSQTKGMPVSLRNSRSRNPSFIAPAEDTYAFTLQVRDDRGTLSLPDEIRAFARESLSGTALPTPNLAQQSGGLTGAQAAAFEVQGGGGGGGCFIATATSGSKSSWLVNKFTRFRDHVLFSTDLGIRLMKAYYLWSPPLAKRISQDESLRFGAALLLYPLAFFLNLSSGWLFALLGLLTWLLLRPLVRSKLHE